MRPYYSADLNLFNSFYKEFIDVKSIKYPRNLLFVGRLEEIKGVRQLIRSFNSIDNTNGWKLTIVGRGSLKNELVTTSSFNNRIKFVDFQNQDNFGNVILNCGFFVLPSISEPWGVVVHEFAASGLPLLLSNQVEAGSAFLRTGYNGFSFNHALKNDLTDKLKIIEEFISPYLFEWNENNLNSNSSYNDDMKEKRDRWIETLEKDIYVDEAMNLLKDLSSFNGNDILSQTNQERILID